MANDGGTTFKARPTVYKGIHMRSRLEAGFAMWLDEHGALWDYEPQCFASPAGQYLPDFGVSMAVVPMGPELVRRYIEVKPYLPPPHDVRRWLEVLNDNGVPSLLIVTADRPERAIWAHLDPGRPDGVVCYHYDWVVDGLGCIGLGLTMPPPWQGEWWKGPDV